VLGQGGADVSLVVPAVGLAVAKLADNDGGASGSGGGGGGGGGGDGASNSGAAAAAEAVASLDIASDLTAAASAAAKVDAAKSELQRAVHEEYRRLVGEEGMVANEDTGRAAIKNVREKMLASWKS